LIITLFIYRFYINRRWRWRGKRKVRV